MTSEPPKLAAAARGGPRGLGVAAAAAPMIAEGGQEGSEAVLALADEVLHELAARDVARTKLATAAATADAKAAAPAAATAAVSTHTSPSVSELGHSPAPQ